MTGARKKFEPDLYNRYDGPAKQAMRQHLEASGHSVTVPPENYGADLYSEQDGVLMYHEVEVSQGWKKGNHPFFNGSIPERKIRLVRMHRGEPLFFWMLRADLKRALVFSAVHMVPRWLVEVPNKKIEAGEYFYRMPKRLGKEFELLI